ncbi:MarR family winged helix-turn-helix transcriptional regulator [Dongia sp.]|uniref:MarR family winged helix-turn-helix transcriptional regulator n=1 Tax=Dongia sp. TaxID=1977262 RepID=UPI0037532BBA
MRMKHEPSDAAVTAWARLVRAGQSVLEKIEAELKAADLPPLSWYDVLLELSRTADGRLRPLELEQRTLLAQYNASRLIDRMVKAGLVERLPHPEDGRGQLVVITAEGRAMQKRVWKVYGPAIERHVGAKLRPAEAVELARLLQKLIA